MSSVGLVLGGGGITGASYHFGTLFALQMATGWNATKADVVIGTSSGSFIAALVRGGALNLDTMVGESRHDDEVVEWLSGNVYQRIRPRGLMRWVRPVSYTHLTLPTSDLV